MARRVFFSFHYQHDIWRVNQIRNAHIVDGTAAAGFQDASLWERTKAQGDEAIKRLIRTGLEGTTVTAVLIGTNTWQRKYVTYEIEQSIQRHNGILAIFIHNIPDQRGQPSPPGLVPPILTAIKVPCYYWNRDLFGYWVEEAARRAGQSSIPPFPPPFRF